MQLEELEKCVDALNADGLEVKCPACRKWTASFFCYDGKERLFRCGGCRKIVNDCKCRPPDNQLLGALETHLRHRLRWNQQQLRANAGGSMTRYYRGSAHEARLALDLLK